MKPTPHAPIDTDDLIAALSARLEPTSPRAPWAWLAIFVGAGVTVAFGSMWLRLGLRPDLPAAVATPMFWTKFLYTVALGGLGLWLAERLCRPGANPGRPARMLQSVVFGFLILAAFRYFGTAAPAKHAALMGHSASLCPWVILTMSIPILIGAIVGMRRMAPTQPTLAGFAGGLAAGGLAAFVYAFSCNESGMPFVAVWYTLPVLGAGLIGAAAGRLLLRW